MGRYPKARFLMKMHPRTKYNRYLGKVEIMDSRDIPWEVYAMNRARCGAKDLIQMSITCGTMLSDKLMFNHEGTKIFTAPLFYDKIRRGNDDAPRVCPENTDTIRRFKETYKNPERFIITDTREELYGALDKRLLGR